VDDLVDRSAEFVDRPADLVDRPADLVDRSADLVDRVAEASRREPSIWCSVVSMNEESDERVVSSEHSTA
jgi:hypothetical protein